MAIHDIYLKIEQIAAYSPVEPELKVMPPRQHRRDCMRNPVTRTRSSPRQKSRRGG
jgi:hypothetical protein